MWIVGYKFALIINNFYSWPSVVGITMASEVIMLYLQSCICILMVDSEEGNQYTAVLSRE